MSKSRFDKYIKSVRRDLEDVVEDVGETYDSVREDVSRRAGKAWAKRGDYADDLMSYGECAVDAVGKRFRADPLGTLAVGAICVWFLGRMMRR